MASGFVVQGHRGARGLFPENTLTGFAATVALGVPAIEFDVVLTADDVPVVHHDEALHPDSARDPSGAWVAPSGPPIRTLTAAELRHFDVGRLRPGSELARRFPNQQPQDGARIPLLSEVLALRPAPHLDIELKTPGRHPAGIVAAALDRAGAVGRAAIRSFDWSGLRWLRAHRPDIALVWLTLAENAMAPDAVAWAAADGPAVAWRPVWAPDHATLTRDLIARAHALGLGVVPWTVNAPDDMARLAVWGVDGICTDRPDVALRLFRDLMPRPGSSP